MRFGGHVVGTGGGVEYKDGGGFGDGRVGLFAHLDVGGEGVADDAVDHRHGQVQVFGTLGHDETNSREDSKT